MLNTASIKNIRIFAIISILVLHFFLEMDTFKLRIGEHLNLNIYSFSELIIPADLFKFGTIIFFVISGFLFERNVDQYQQDLKRFFFKKYTSLIRPYLLVFVIPICFYLLISPYMGFRESLTIKLFFARLIRETFLTNYWFIPTLILYFLLNFFIPSRKIVPFLAGSAIITILFSVNIYIHILPLTYHTTTGLGFLSFFLFGRYLFLNPNTSICRHNGDLLACILILSFLFSYMEGYYLYFVRHIDDFMNTLRFSNLIYSLAVLELFNRLFSNRQLPKALSQANTYFIYLFHPHIIRMLNFWEVRHPFFASSKNTWGISLLFTAFFIGLCFVLEMFSRKITFRGRTVQSFFFTDSSPKKEIIHNPSKQPHLEPE